MTPTRQFVAVFDRGRVKHSRVFFLRWPSGSSDIMFMTLFGFLFSRFRFPRLLLHLSGSHIQGKVRGAGCPVA